MSFEGAWGFDPDSALRAQDLFRWIVAGSDIMAEETGKGVNDNNFLGDARIPVSRDAQIHELQRLFRL